MDEKVWMNIAKECLSGEKDYDFIDRFLKIAKIDNLKYYLEENKGNSSEEYDMVWKMCLKIPENVEQQNVYFPLYRLMHWMICEKGYEELAEQMNYCVESFCNLYFYKIIRTVENYYCHKVRENGTKEEFCHWLQTEGYQKMYMEYPVAFQQIFHVFDYICQNVAECFERLQLHSEEIEKHLKIRMDAEISSIDCTASDLHNGGKSVIILRYKNGQGIVYKPRNMGIDMLWNDFLQLFNSFEGVLKLKDVETLTFEEYGFCTCMQYQPHMTEKEIEEYYECFGELLAIVVMFGGTDFHHENVMVTEKRPVLLDLETLLTPVSKTEYASATEYKKIKNENSLNLSKSLLLTKWVGTRFDTAVNIGALTAYNPGHHNYPRRENNEIAYADLYTEHILRGYENGYRAIIRHREEIKFFLLQTEDVYVRFVLRDTRVYYKLISFLTNPRFLHEKEMYKAASLRIYAPFLLATTDDICSRLFPMMKTEQEALLQGDIPIFYCHMRETNLYAASGRQLVQDFFQKTPMNMVLETLNDFSEEHLQREKRYLNTLLQISKVHRRPDYKSIWSYLNVERKWGIPCGDAGKFCASEADRIYRIIRENMLDEEQMTFYAPIKDKLNGYYDLEVMKNTLYDGTLGVYYYLGIYWMWKGKCKETERLTCFLKKWCEEFLQEDSKLKFYNLGFSSGVAGMLFFLYKYGEVVGDSDFNRLCVKIILQITNKDLSAQKETDYFGGLSGLLYSEALVLEKCDEYYKEKIRSRMTELTAMLLNTRNPAGNLWFDPDNQYEPLLGLAHGQTGYALALSETYKYLTGEFKKKTGDAIKCLLNYEESKFSEEDNNLPDYRKFFVKMRDVEPDKYIKRYMYGNCSGIIGVALAYGKIFKNIDQEWKTDKWYERALDFLEDNRNLPGNDSLCCGTAAWLDLLNEIEKKPQFADRAKKMKNKIVTVLKRDGYIFNCLTNIDDISLYRGITGIGYSYLRILGDWPGIVI